MSMSTSQAQKILGERFEKLPAGLQDAITSVDLREELKAVSQEHKLHIDQAGKLEDETALVMMGFESPDAYPDNLQRELDVDAETAQAITEAVNERIFLPIREEMQKLESQFSRKERGETSTPASPEAEEAEVDRETALRELEDEANPKTGEDHEQERVPDSAPENTERDASADGADRGTAHATDTENTKQEAPDARANSQSPETAGQIHNEIVDTPKSEPKENAPASEPESDGESATSDEPEQEQEKQRTQDPYREPID